MALLGEGQPRSIWRLCLLSADTRSSGLLSLWLLCPTGKSLGSFGGILLCPRTPRGSSTPSVAHLSATALRELLFCVISPWARGALPGLLSAPTAGCCNPRPPGSFLFPDYALSVPGSLEPVPTCSAPAGADNCLVYFCFQHQEIRSY